MYIYVALAAADVETNTELHRLAVGVIVKMEE